MASIAKGTKSAGAGDAWRSMYLRPNKPFDLLVCQTFTVERRRLGTACQDASVLRSQNRGAEFPLWNLF